MTSETLEISRRIEREAGSVYRINGRDVRARDVQILFADAATGARSPALVHQGKIGEIIQAKPEQRRRVLEDAAGVAGLHARRHEAELRLKAAETNLTRVEDVIGQLAGQIDGLKKQARQAIRYREVAAKVRKAEATLFHLRWLEANADVGGSRAAPTTSAFARWPSAPASRPEAARIQAIRASELPALREGEARAAAGLQRLTNARELLDREEERAKERVAELDRRLTQFAADIAREQQQTSDAEVALQRLDTEDAGVEGRDQVARRKRCGVDERVSEAEATLGRRRTPVRRADHRARRPHRQAQSARGRRPHPSRPAGAARSGNRQRPGRGAEAGAGDRRSRRPRRTRGAMETAQETSGAVRKPRRRPARPATSPPARSWKLPRAARRRPTSACSGSRPKRARSRNSSTARPRTCGRRSSTASPSPRAMRRRLAPRSATISTPRSTRRRRCAGPMPASTDGDPALPDGRRGARRPCRGAVRAGAPPGADRRRGQESAAPNWCRS